MRCINIMIKVLLCQNIIFADAVSVDDIKEDIIAQYCPMVDICDRNASSATLRPNGILEYGKDEISCCHGCSCHPDCKRNNNCCYPEEEIADPVCSHMKVGHDDDQKGGVEVPSFYTISAEPPDGCNDVTPFYSISGETMTPSCSQQPLPYWDNYFPVLSNTSKNIYKNEACACCHGITEYEPFTAYLVCKDTADSRRAGITLADHIKALERNVLSPFCYINFEHSDVYALSRKRCIKEDYIQDTCESQTFSRTMPPLGLTWDTMKTECEEGVKSPLVVYGKAFRNIFCAMCHFPSIQTEDVVCKATVSRTDFNALSMAFVLDYRPIKAPKDHLDWKKTPMACLKDNYLQDGNTCRRILCPTGMKRNNQGECVFIIKTWLTLGFSVQVRLLEVNGVNISLMDGDTMGLTEEILQQSPWPTRWQAYGVLIKEKDGLRKTDAGLIVAFTHTQGNYSYEHFVSAANQALSTPWVVEYNGTQLMFNQSILEYKLWFERLPGDTIIYRPFWTNLVRENLSQIHVNDSAVWLSSGFTVRTFRHLHFLSKLYLCKQVELQHDEFDTIVDRSLIKNRLTGEYMFDQEFEMVEDEAGINVARVCLSDTPFQEKSSGCHEVSQFTIIMVCAVIVFNIGQY